MTFLRKTFSVCPVCLKKVEASLESDGEDVYLNKHCAEHGNFSAIAWRGKPSILDWTGQRPELDDVGNCPMSCGICPGHQQNTCCLLLEITDRCNLECPHCFAESSRAGMHDDPTLAQVKTWVEDIASTGKAFLQLSGGEPSLRDDLPDIIKHAKDYGCEYVQLNSNGLRLAEDEAFVEALSQAGLSFVFMQFDGTNDGIYRKMRGRDLLEKKLKAIELCGHHNIGVTLVPTLVPGINDNDIGDIIKLAIKLSPIVRGVHFQPVSYFGRFPREPKNASRMTLPEVLNAVYSQTGTLLPADSLAASCCDHPRCGFHGAYIVMPDASLKAYTTRKENSCCPTPTPADYNRHFVGLRWQRYKYNDTRAKADIPMARPSNYDINTLDGFLARARSHSFTISAMAFQDAYTLDLERLRQCSLHVYSNGLKVPFCSYYISGGGKYGRFARR